MSEWESFAGERINSGSDFLGFLFSSFTRYTNVCFLTHFRNVSEPNWELSTELKVINIIFRWTLCTKQLKHFRFFNVCTFPSRSQANTGRLTKIPCKVNRRWAWTFRISKPTIFRLFAVCSSSSSPFHEISENFFFHIISRGLQTSATVHYESWGDLRHFRAMTRLLLIIHNRESRQTRTPYIIPFVAEIRLLNCPKHFHTSSLSPQLLKPKFTMAYGMRCADNRE